MEYPHAILMDALRRKNAVLEGINRIFREALSARSEETLGQLCLAVAEDVTGAAFSFMGEVNRATGRLDDLAISERGWAAFTRDDPQWPRGKLLSGFHVHGLHGRVVRDGVSLIANDPATHPDRIGTPDGHPPLNNFLGVPLRHDGRVIGLIALGNREGGFRDEEREMVEEMAPAIVQALMRQRAEQRLRESDAMRDVMFELVPAMLWRADAEGRTVTSNRQWQRLTGQPFSESSDWGWLKQIHPDDAATSERVFRHAFAGGEPLIHQHRVRHRDGSYRWYLVRQFPVRDADDTITHWFGAATDVTELRVLQDRQRELVAELQYRVRNILTVVRSVFAQTVDSRDSLEDVADHFRGRLDSLARTQSVVAQTASGRVDLENLVRDELLNVGVGEGAGLRLDGPDVALPPMVAEVLGLAIHELAINAVKFGAFKVPGGRVDIAWTLAAAVDGALPRLRLAWTECGVPAVPIAPGRQGFGTLLIEDSLPRRLDATARLEFLGGGIRCLVDVPLVDGDTTF